MCNYLSTNEDLNIAVAGIRKTREIMKSKALEKFMPQEMLPGENLQTDTELKNAAKDLGTTIFHPIGTCSMGKIDINGNTDNQMSVLDSECRVRGVSRLRVIDASSMPIITSGNTNAPVMLIAETVVRRILAQN
jgi:choline dehydrogenase